MQIRRSRLGRHSAILAIAAALLGTVSVDLAVAAGPSRTIKACAAKSSGALRIAKRCKTSETAVSWNSVGPRGPKGAQGKQGIQGEPGNPGPAAKQIDESTTDLTTGASDTIFPFASSNEAIEAGCGLEGGVATPTAYANLIFDAGSGSALPLEGTGTTDVTLGTGGTAVASNGSPSPPPPLPAGVSAYSESASEQYVLVSTTSASPTALSGTYLLRQGNTLFTVTAYLSASLTSCDLRAIEVPGPVATP